MRVPGKYSDTRVRQGMRLIQGMRLTQGMRLIPLPCWFAVACARTSSQIASKSADASKPGDFSAIYKRGQVVWNGGTEAGTKTQGLIKFSTSPQYYYHIIIIIMVITTKRHRDSWKDSGSPVCPGPNPPVSPLCPKELAPTEGQPQLATTAPRICIFSPTEVQLQSGVVT